MDNVKKTLVARVKHKCSWCTIIIMPKEEYIRSVTFDDGSVYTLKGCLLCDRAINQAFDAGYDNWEGLMSVESFREWAYDYRFESKSAHTIVERLSGYYDEACDSP